MIPDTDGKTMPIEVDVGKDTAGEEVSNYRNGSPRRGFGDNVSQTPW